MQIFISSGTACMLLMCTFISSLAVGQTERGEDPLSITRQNQNTSDADTLPSPSAGEILAKKQLALEAKEAELEQATKDLAIIEKRIDDKISRLEKLVEEKKRIEQGLLTAKEQEKEQRLAKMVEVTGKMPPENAALYLMELSIDTATKVITTLKSRKGAAILAAMPPSNAAEIGREYLESGKPKSTANSTPGNKNQN